MAEAGCWAATAAAWGLRQPSTGHQVMSDLRRLIDLPGVADLEFKALMKPGYADPDQRADYPEVDACSQAAFGLTAEAAEAAERPQDWTAIERLEPRDQVARFEAAGWDVTDDKR